ncbi:sensor domain-containing protein [Rhodospirillum rubrum]|uniref:Diguanylate cyclase/phosphodiesterase n=1 Tax=Rhodospirillum rubrum (strain ATCC 11170 / ATH 1.1.1 / DSM 467 / LMG 4362 / NCIMB 8255 / S1) TaxID=269796 RepID=Q2RPL3_RHORT|nr:bifunctional diguanylate cyclase/phosphodiesterase [Rhodospirillum rubrum]ABC23932.1 diguanylate cyclase/phosphodiesterase [Rhodospirillum rubrum ATCC 11170]AEO49676.1 diguanylate cyclase/phosphodiesterase [Rhodospirillum rubrum F11]MBK5955630.1 GGDEF domain-containing protein [Rhodospirillum rubrum]QXG79876.1 EAL domain-containing protein [Rhodospirillum rubrum]HCF19369.1 bifunctional diguanylate cyclase/phosphodiesterase [Rhodospirillum rubrum]
MVQVPPPPPTGFADHASAAEDREAGDGPAPSIAEGLSAALFQSVVEALPVGTALLRDGVIVHANATLAGQIGETIDTLIGSPLTSYLTPADALAVQKVVEGAIALHGGVPVRRIAHIRHISGSERVYSLRFSPLDNGPHPLLVVITRDMTAQVAAENALRAAEGKYRAIFENAVEGIYQSTPDGTYLDVNPALARIYGYASPAELIAHFTDIASQLYVDGTKRGEFQRLMRETGEVRDFTAEVWRCDGHTIWITENARCVRGPDNEVLYYEGTVEDITAQRQSQETMRLLGKVFTSIAEGIVLLERDLTVRTVNPAFEAMTGLLRQDMEGRPARLFASGLHENDFLATVAAEVDRAGLWRGEIWGERREGPPYSGEMTVTAVRTRAGETTHYVAAITDITKRKRDEEHIRFQANFDMLTHLPNRHLIMDRLEQAMHQAQRTGRQVCVMFLDLDRFKQINDSYGHSAGDEVLKLTARRLRNCVRISDSVGRLGGDEFIVILSNVEDQHAGAYIAEKILYSLSEPFPIGGTEVFCIPSVGITYFPDHGETAPDLLRNADVAMYHAKQGGERRYAIFTPDMARRSLALLTMESDLRHALARDEFELHFQPKVRADLTLIGAEALIRWRHPEKGLINPGDFIPLAEESGLILPIGRWTLREACDRVMSWRAEGLTIPSVSVNVSPRQFQDQTLVETVRQILVETGLEPEALDLEITETVMTGDVEHAVGTLRALKDLGVTLSIDDFGTGYSSLNYLKTFPIDTLKIDQTFVRDVLHSGKDAAIVSTIIALARNLGFSVVAEGVEEIEQAEFLGSRDCQNFQGFLYSRPLPPAEFTTFLRTAKLETATPPDLVPSIAPGP